MKTKLTSLLSALLISGVAVMADPVDNLDQFFTTDGVMVTPETYPTHETSHQLLKNQDLAGINTLLHKRQLTPTDKQPVVRMNRDTYYSFAVVDVSEGASITIPELPEGKYVSVQPVTEDHRIQPMFYGAGTFDLTTHVGSHLYVVVRLDSTFSKAEAAKYQDQMSLTATSDKPFMAEPVNRESFERVENALKAKMPMIMERDGKDATFGMFTGANDESSKLFTQEKYEVGAAIGWGGAQPIDNIYEVSGNYPANVPHQATFKDPENGAFWSITVYDKAGFMFNDHAHLSSNTAVPNSDGTYTINFGGGEDATNNIEIDNDSGVFTLAVRHYQPSNLVSKEGFRILPTVKAVE